MMKRSNRLTAGGAIGVFSPSEPIIERRRPRLERGFEILRSHGFEVVPGSGVYAHCGFDAGTVHERLGDISSLLDNRAVKAMMTSWGGKSASQLLAGLDYRRIGRARKPFLGFSDGCVILNAITALTGLVTFHGPNVVGKLDESRHADLKLLSDPAWGLQRNLLGDVREPVALRRGRASGVLFGGNLSTFTLGLIGSRYMPRYRNGIFFWENAGERPQLVSQLMFTLRNAGMFDGLSGMVIGDFVVPEPDEYKRRDPFDVVLEATAGYSFPVLHCRTFGHPPELENPILPIGASVDLDADAGHLSLREPVVE